VHVPDLQTLFEGIAEPDVEAARKRFFQMDRAPGDVVVEEGETHDSMFIVESGQVSVSVGGFEVATLGPGSCVGEIGLFTTSVRTATVKAATPVTFHLLSRKAYTELKAAGNPITVQLERRAVGQLGARLRQLIADIRLVAGRARGMLLEPVQTRQTAGTHAPLPEAAVIASMKDMVAFEGEDEAAFASLASLASHRVFAEGDTISQVGRRDGPLQLLVSGRVDCRVTLEVDQVRAASLSGGELFNVLPFVDGQPRPYTFVATAPSTTLAISKAHARELMERRGPAASALRIAMIRSLADRVNQANATYSLAKLTRLEVDSTPRPAPRTLPRATRREDPDGDATYSAPAPEVHVPPEPQAAPIPPAPFEEGAPELTPPHRAPDDIETQKTPGFDPRTFVPPAPLHVGQPVEPGPSRRLDENTPWFDGTEPEWDTWFELTDEVSL
jgi:CRP-like cAMP-binding protein